MHRVQSWWGRIGGMDGLSIANLLNHRANLFNRYPRPNDIDDMSHGGIVAGADRVEQGLHEPAQERRLLLEPLITSFATLIRPLVEDAFSTMCLAFRACWWGATTLTEGRNRKKLDRSHFQRTAGFTRGGWEGSKYPCPALLAFFACSRGPFQLALVRGTSAGRLVAPRAAGRNSPWSNGSQGPAYVTHRGEREEGGGEEGEVLGSVDAGEPE